jgi:hypothetical protein
VVLVHDSLASDKPRAWEWNIHAMAKMGKLSDKVIQVRNGAAKMCVEMLVSPEVSFEQTDKFTAPPRGKDTAPQWHGTFVSAAKSNRAEFVALMRIGAECTAGSTRSAIVSPTAEGLRVQVGSSAVTFGPGGASVEDRGAAPMLVKNLR